MKNVLIIFAILLLLSACTSEQAQKNRFPEPQVTKSEEISSFDFDIVKDLPPDKCKMNIPRTEVDSDRDGDSIKDLEDILEGARKDMENKPRYRSAYYKGGYPPDNEGVCTDVIWRALENAGYNLKDMVDSDIRENMACYPRVAGKPDPNIDFRRVKNLVPFFQKYATVLTKEVIPGDVENLKEWQAGDIVVFGEPLEHIAIVSDKRRKDGVPYIIHNAGPYTKENDRLLDWPSPITHHFRFPK